MKFNMKKAVATALAVTMCVPFSAFAAQTGSFDTSFDVYSPVLTINVPTKLDVRVNPIADTSKGVQRFGVASNSIDIMNASVDVEKDAAIPVNVTVKAQISTAADDVVTAYNTFTADSTSTKKKIYLELSEANTAAVFGAGKDDQGTALAPAFDNDKRLVLSNYAVATAAEYDSIANKAAITKYGSLLSMDIAGPATTDSTAGATYSSDATKVSAAVGSFAITGAANTNADWKASDVAVAVTYNVKASQPLTITTPKLTTAPSAAAGADVSFTITGIGEATVTALAVHNDESDYGDYIWDAEDVTVDYSTPGSVEITVAKDNAALGVLASDALKGKPQDLVVALSDGRMVVSTLTIN